MNLIQFLCSMFDDKEEILKCLDISTIIDFDNTNVLIANDNYIFYFGSLKPKTKQFKEFYEKNKEKMIGKRLISENTGYMDRMQYVRTIPSTGQKEYVWLG